MSCGPDWHATRDEHCQCARLDTASRTADADVTVQFELSDATERFGVVARGQFGGQTTFGHGSDDSYLVADVGNGQVFRMDKLYTERPAGGFGSLFTRKALIDWFQRQV